MTPNRHLRKHGHLREDSKGRGPRGKQSQTTDNQTSPAGISTQTPTWELGAGKRMGRASCRIRLIRRDAWFASTGDPAKVIRCSTASAEPPRTATARTSVLRSWTLIKETDMEAYRQGR